MPCIDEIFAVKSNVILVTESEKHVQRCGNILANPLPDSSALERCNDNSIISCPSEKRRREEFNVDDDSKHPKLGKNVNGLVGWEIQDCSLETDSGFFPGNRNPKDQDDADFSRKATSDCYTTKPCNVSDKEVSATVSMTNGFGADVYGGEETKLVGMQRGEDISQRALRLALPQIRPRSFSPGGQLNDGNKRPTIICAFLTKGWCIKGNSCRFLHIRDQVDASSRHNDGDLTQKSSPTDEDGIQPGRSKEPQNLPISSIPSLKDVGTESPMENWRLDDCGSYASSILKARSPTYRDSPFHGTFSISSMIMSDNQSSYSTSSAEMVQRGDFSSKHVLAANRRSLPSKVLPWNADPLGSQRLLGSDREYSDSKSASLMQSSSPFSVYELENLSRTKIYGDIPLTAKYKMNMPSNDWEPSLPFKPTFFISKYLSCTENQYDPMHHSIEQLKSEFKFPKFSSCEGTSIHGMHVGNLGSRFSFDNHSLASRYSHEDRVLGKNDWKKDLFTMKTQTVGASSCGQQSIYSLSGEKKLLSPAHSTDTKNADSAVVDSDYKLKSDEWRQPTELKVDQARQDDKIDVDSKTDVNTNKESRALKKFRAALIDFVKELVKPTWHEGHLSKDAHKIIVKRAVDKILSTLQADQVPSTAELVKQYLPFSEQKIAKLVEGYIKKYGKS